MRYRIGLAATMLLLGGCSAPFVLRQAADPSIEAEGLAKDAEIQPYLQNSSEDAISVLWRTAKPGVGSVSAMGPDGKAVEISEGSVTQDHRVRLTGLRPGTTYRYRVSVDGREVLKSNFRTHLPRGGGSFTFAAMGDMGSGSPDQYAVAQQVGRYAPAFTVLTGDIIYPRGAEGDYIPKFFKPYAPLINKQVFFPSIGNHDILTWLGKPYFRFFETPQSPIEATERYYAFQYGDVDFFSVDSNQAFTSLLPQYRWLAGSLANSKAKWKVVFFHHPPYSSGSHGSSSMVRDHLSPLFERYGVDLVLNGHDHHYERTHPMRTYVPEGRAVTYVLTGGGGTKLRSVGSSDFTAIAKSVHHFVGVTVEADRLRVEAVDKAGQVFDRADITK